MTTRMQVRRFIADYLLLSRNGFGFSDDASLLEEQAVDSVGVMELVVFVEEQFGIEVIDNEIVPDNFDTVNNLVAYIERKTA